MSEWNDYLQCMIHQLLTIELDCAIGAAKYIQYPVETRHNLQIIRTSVYLNGCKTTKMIVGTEYMKDVKGVLPNEPSKIFGAYWPENLFIPHSCQIKAAFVSDIENNPLKRTITEHLADLP